jgi:hypothetical protein
MSLEWLVFPAIALLSVGGGMLVAWLLTAPSSAPPFDETLANARASSIHARDDAMLASIRCLPPLRINPLFLRGGYDHHGNGFGSAAHVKCVRAGPRTAHLDVGHRAVPAFRPDPRLSNPSPR